MEKYLIASPHVDAGLCNRLKCIISVLRLTDYSRSKSLFHWPLSFTCGAQFTDLFETSLPLISPQELSEIIKRGYTLLEKYEDIHSTHANLICNTWRFLLLPDEVSHGFSKVFPENTGRNIDLEYERIPPKVRKAIIPYVNSLIPIQEIRTQIKQFMSKYAVEKMVGLHIRRTEFLLNADGRGQVSSDDLFSKEIQSILSHNPKTKFFLATDSKKTEEKYLEAFKDCMVVFPYKNWDKSTKESTQHALIDLLLLSKTSRILGTYLSTFTEMAWWFGGCKPKVTIIGDEQEKRNVIERYKSLATRPKFIQVLRKPLKDLRRRSKFFRRLVDLVLRSRTAIET